MEILCTIFATSYEPVIVLQHEFCKTNRLNNWHETMKEGMELRMRVGLLERKHPEPEPTQEYVQG